LNASVEVHEITLQIGMHFPSLQGRMHSHF